MGPFALGNHVSIGIHEFFKELEPICPREITNPVFLEEVEDT
jgi:hypothetical protein